MQHRQGRLGAVLDGQGDIGQQGRLGWLAELADIGAGDKGAPGAVQQYQLDRAVLPGFGEGLQKTLPHRLGQGIHRRVVDADDSDTAYPRQAHER
ncbi:hypothetical protein D3C71_1996690 [compost metagenome]